MDKLVIYKYRLPAEQAAEIEIPSGAHILSLQMQEGVPTIWARVNPNAAPVKRIIYVLPTGLPHDPFDDQYYLGTLQFTGGMVLHFFISAEPQNG